MASLYPAPVPAQYIGPDQCTVGPDRAPEFLPGVRVWADCGPAGAVLATVRTCAVDPARALLTLDCDAGGLTAGLVGLLHSNDNPESLCNHAAQHAAGGRDPLTPAEIGAASTVALAAVHQAVLDEQADLDDAVSALETAVNLRVPVSRAINATFPIQGGGGLEADRTLALVVAVVSELLGYGVTLSGKVVTDQILKAITKLLISANTTIYVATTGSDATGTGLAGAPFASIHKALASLSGMLIATGVIVTIQVADGTYAVNAPIVIEHTDAERIQILGNILAETTAAIASIDSANKAFVVAGNQTDAVGLAFGDRFTVLNGTTANIGIYTVVSKSYSGGNTTITVSESIASSAAGDAVITLKPCNSVVLNCQAGVTAFIIRTKLSLINGFHIKGSGGGSIGFSLKPLSYCSIRQNTIVSGFYFGIIAELNAALALYGPAIHGGSYGLNCNTGSKCVLYTAKTIIDGASTKAIQAEDGSNVKLSGLFINGGHNPASPFSPALNTYGVNGNAFIAA